MRLASSLTREHLGMDILHVEIWLTGLLISIVLYHIPWSELLQKTALGAGEDDDESSSERKIHLVIAGATGDLALRYIFPALLSLKIDNFTAELQPIIHATSRQAPEITRNALEHCVNAAATASYPEHQRSDFLSSVKYHQLQTGEDFERLCTNIRVDDNVVFYLSIPPSAYANTVKNIGLFCKNGRREANIRIVLEKPFGADYDSARTLFEELEQWFPFERYYLVDHYKAKEAVMVIPEFFAQNPDIAENFFSSRSPKLELVFNETLGVAGRIAFYDETGVIRDVVQNHLMEILVDILSAIMKKVNSDLERSDLITKMSIDTVNYGQYESYNQELVKSAVRERPSNTPTFVHAEASLKSTLLNNVQISFTAGKNLSRKVSLARLTFDNGSSNKEVIFHISGDGLNYPAVLLRGFELNAVKCPFGLPLITEVRYSVSHDHSEKWYEMCQLRTKFRNVYEDVVKDVLRREHRHSTDVEFILKSWTLWAPWIKS